ncbi:hypothetical protein MMC11_003728 [Xylographa trunciseda]|nr:hypothetical protein [Xylographa trunciseda]
MSLVNLSHLCSHLQNASKARLGLTSLPHTNLHLSLLHSLQRAGFLSTITLGGPTPPPPSPILGHPQDPAGSAITQTNRATRRLWVGLKYWDNEPVLSRMGMVSKPTRRIWMGVEELRDVARGVKSGYVEGLKGIGECLFVSTDRGIMEVRECVERGVGGMVLCRVL